VGAGGGFIFVPALLLILEVEPIIAASSGLVIVLINSISGTFGYFKQNRIDYKIGLLISGGALPGSLLGVWLLQVYTSSYFFIIFATILVLLGIILLIKNIFFSKFNNYKYISIERNAILVKCLIPLGVLMGLLSSYLGIGGGWLLVPVLIYIFKLPPHIATATSIFSLSIYSFYGVVAQLFYNSIDINIVLWGGIGVILGSQLGVKLSSYLPGKVIMQLLSIILIGVGIRMYFT